jgi:peptidoglycan/xylan/chitin deacetylase (PgdA/CDA1 family)
MNPVSLLFHDIYLTDPRESGFASAAADRYKLPLSDFDAQLEGLADTANPFVITVDDGGVSYYTLMAERLEARGWRGHCFVSTGMIGQPGFLTPAQIRELDARGHVIGSHSVTHPARFSACSYEQMRGEWTDSRKTLEDILGHAVTVASVPGGYYSKRVAQSAAQSGLRVLFNSEPTTAVQQSADLQVVGRYTIRRGDPNDAARKLAAPEPWARYAAWASWNAKGIVKPLLGPSYRRVADWVLATRPRSAEAPGAEGTRATWS